MANKMKKYIKSVYNSKYFNVLLFSLFLFIPYFLFGNMYENNDIFVSGDGLGFFSMRFFTMRSILNGEIPLWNPLLEMGVPWAADFYGTFYPLQWLMLFLSPKNFIFLYYGFHIAIGGLFTYLFLKEEGNTKEAALIAGIIYVFSIHIGGLRKSHMILIVAIVYMPVILYWIRKYLNTLDFRYILASSVSMGIVFYSGAHIQYLVYMDLAAGIYFLVMLIWQKTKVKKIIYVVGSWVGIYFALIAMQIIPAIEMLQFYEKSGATDMSYGSFASYSIHPVKLLMMVFPSVFNGELYQPMGAGYSSEMDIELFLGVAVLIVIVYSILFVKKNVSYWLYLSFMLISFLYASCAHIPYLGQLIYKLPLLGNFRVPSRTLFIFIFFNICMLTKGMDTLYLALKKEGLSQTAYHFQKYLRIVLVIFTALFTLLSLLLFISSYDGTRESIFLVQKKTGSLLPALIVTVIFTGIIGIIYKYCRICRYKSTLLLMSILLLTIGETVPFYIFTQGSSVDSYFAASESWVALKDKAGKDKVLLASPNIDGNYSSMISFSRNLVFDVATINAYVSINNPSLYHLMSNTMGMEASYNLSGLYTGFQDIKNNLVLENDLLSMLGVKYIIDQEDMVDASGRVISDMHDKDIVYQSEVMQTMNNPGEINVIQDEIMLKPETYYEISLSLYSEEEQEAYLDFYGGSAYDNPQQESHFQLSRGTNHIEILLHSGKLDDSLQTVWRLVSVPEGIIELQNIDISEQEPVWGEQVYYPIYSDEQMVIYENRNAKEILSAPNEVREVADSEEVYENKKQMQFDKISYVVGSDSFACGDTKIKILEQKNNEVSARVKCESRSFINFSQNYYPGWNVYIDGIKQENHLVNGVIQGCIVEEGEHVVEFKFQPVSFYTGMIITLIASGLVIFIYIKKKKVPTFI